MSWFSRFKNAWNPRRLDEDLAEELRDHMERRAADLQRRGLSEPEAHRQAARRFGNLTGIRETSRELRLWATLDDTLQDVRYAWRGLIRNPIFAVTTIASLASRDRGEHSDLLYRGGCPVAAAAAFSSGPAGYSCGGR